MFERWSSLILLNPVAPILEGIGAAVVGTPFLASAGSCTAGCSQPSAS